MASDSSWAGWPTPSWLKGKRTIMFSPYGQPGSKSDPLSGVVAGRGWTSFRVASKASRTALRMTQYATWHHTAVVFPDSVRNLPLFWIISRHGGWERAGLGSGSGFGSGDAAFDEQVLLAGPAAQQARAAGLISAEVKAAVLDVLAVDRSVAIKVVGELSMLMCWVEAEDARDGRFPPLVDRLARLVGSLEAAAGMPRAAAVPVAPVAPVPPAVPAPAMPTAPAMPVAPVWPPSGQPTPTRRMPLTNRTAILAGIAVAGAAAVVLVAVLGQTNGTVGSSQASGTTVATSHGSSNGTRSTAQGWSKSSLGAPVVGTWATGTDIIVATSAGLTAYQAASGAQDWISPLPAGDTICKVSQSSSGPLGAVVYGNGNGNGSGSGNSCGNLEIVNLATGQPTSSAPISLTGSDGQGSYGNGAIPSIQGSTLVAPFGQNGLVDIDVPSGKAVWNTDNSAVAGPAAAGCSVIGGAVAMGTSIYTVQGNCSDGSSHVWAYNATTAAPPAVLNLPTPCTNPGLLQTGADLLAVCNEGQDSAALLLLTPGASAFTPVQVQHPDAVGIATDASGASSGQATLTGLAVSGSILYVPDWANGMVSVAAITAVDLTNGSTLWTTPFPASDMEPSLLGATSAGALVEYAKDDGTPTVATLTASSGALTAEHAFPGGSGHADTETLVGDYLIGVAGKPGSGGDQLTGAKID
jgi:hypothetical protein